MSGIIFKLNDTQHYEGHTHHTFIIINIIRFFRFQDLVSLAFLREIILRNESF
jgi:hypothetical protein